MRPIVKGHEPRSLTEYRLTPGANYEDYRDKPTLADNLITEQRGLCCYCLSTIPTKAGEMKIEHWHSQTRYRGEQLDYRNLLGACPGGEGKRRKDQHCDARKGEDDLSRNPANPGHQIESFIHFEGSGRISSPDAAFDEELNSVLNLNLEFLVNQRKATLDGFIATLQKRGKLKRPALEGWLRKWNGEGPHTGALDAYCQVVVYWLRKRLSRA